MGWVLTAFLIGYGLMQVPMGRVGDVRGIRFALPAIVLLWSLMTGLTPLAQSFAILFAVRCAFGMAQAGVFPLSVPGIRRWFPLESRTTGQGLVISCTVNVVSANTQCRTPCSLRVLTGVLSHEDQ